MGQQACKPEGVRLAPHLRKDVVHRQERLNPVPKVVRVGWEGHVHDERHARHPARLLQHWLSRTQALPFGGLWHISLHTRWPVRQPRAHEKGHRQVRQNSTEHAAGDTLSPQQGRGLQTVLQMFTE